MLVAILGGGVAGVASAISFQQKGFEVALYERRKQAENIGAGMVLWPNASWVLQQLGLLEKVKNIAGNPEAMHRISDRGENLGSLNIRRIEQNMHYPALAVLRRDLQNLFIEQLQQAGIPIHYSRQAVSIQQRGNQSRIEFSNQNSVDADVVICADGRMASLGRHYVSGENRPQYQGFINWIGVIEWPAPMYQSSDILDYWGVGKRFGIVPINSRTAYWAGGIGAKTVQPIDPQTRHADTLQRLFSDWPDPVAQLVNGPLQGVNQIYVHDHDPLSCWHRHNVLTIGDAAHAPLPTSGQGACQALEDAYVIAQLLAQTFSPGEKATSEDFLSRLQAVFSDFTSQRLQKTSSITMAARHFADSLFQADEKQSQERNRASQSSDFHQMADAMSALWSQGLPRESSYNAG